MVQQEQFIYKNKVWQINIGLNKQDNWNLIDNSKPNDIWFHVDSAPSAHIILSNEENFQLNKIPQQVITRCACLCKSHSKSKSIKDCIIIYTYISNIKKTDKIGEVECTNIKQIKI